VSDALEELAALARATTREPDAETKALAALARAIADAREVDALDLARRLLTSARMPTLALRVAERFDARGDDAAATTVLEPLLLAPQGVSLDAWMLLAEIAERRGDAVTALAHYEHVVSRDYDYPRARERALRLGEIVRGARAADAGATLMGGNARGRFRVLRELGRGGAGTVFLAEDADVGREVALKIYQRRGRAERMRMLHEARVPSRLAHPSVIRVLDVDETVLGIAMELVRGGSLRHAIDHGTIDRGRAITITRGIGVALAHVQASGWVHRDVKPSNVLLDDDRVVLTDFGIASPIGAAGVAGEGSIGFMPAEQRKGAAAATSMDVHALGKTVLEMVHGSDDDPLVSLALAATRADPRARPPLARFLDVA
jgi:serine/threonine-protein kinase